MTDLKNDLEKILQVGAAEMGVRLTNMQVEMLLTYICEFEKWNKAYNLSAVREIRLMVERHLLDSLSVVPCIQSGNFAHSSMIDVGTGGGLPGIPLAIMFPQTQFTLLDSNGKKTRFLFHIKTLLQLTNVTVENRRVEEFNPERKFDAVISRAFASLQDMTQGCAHLLNSDGVFLAMKGIFPQDELIPIAEQITLLQTIKLAVAATEGERHLLVLKSKQ